MENNNQKQNNLPELKWIGTSKTFKSYGSDYDVYVSASKTKVKQPRVEIGFGNNTYLKITKNGYIKFALSGARLYFAQGYCGVGYKVTSFSKDSSIGRIRVDPRLLPIQENKFELGDYKLKFDSSYNLYYIGIETKVRY